MNRPLMHHRYTSDMALLNTGAKSTNVQEYLESVDGVIVGSDLKVDGHTWNPVEAERVARFMAAARG